METLTFGLFCPPVPYRRLINFQEKIHQTLREEVQKNNPNCVVDYSTESFSSTLAKGGRKCEDRLWVEINVHADKLIKDIED